MYEEYLGEGIQTVSSLRELNEDLLFNMSSKQTRETGLPYNLWLDPIRKDQESDFYNSPRIKVEVDEKFIPMLIGDNPDIPDSIRSKCVTDFPHIDLIKKYVSAYKDVLLAHFYNKISDCEALNLLGTIKNAPKAQDKLKTICLLN